MPHPPELVAPAGDAEALRAAVANGADAVYFGLPKFNARQRAANFAVEVLPDVVADLHRHNVKAYVTFNTLIFSEEWPETVELLCAIAEAGADAVVVQDLGLIPLIRKLAPTLRIHASTQMTMTEPNGIRMLAELGVKRVILARELSLSEISLISRETPIELEVFVHGALCISYSGQCLASEAFGGRSANRGLCAQPCRMPYRLISDGRPLDLGDRKYLLSPKDLAGYGLVGQLVKLGISGFKIEGRLKSAQYVALVTRTYREAIDAAMRGEDSFQLSPDREAELSQSFSRGFTQGFLGGGVTPGELVDGRSPKSRGVKLGTVTGRTGRGVILAFQRAQAGSSLKPGDGVVFDHGEAEGEEQGGRVLSVTALPSRHDEAASVEVVLRRGDGEFVDAPVGSIAWKTNDPALDRRIEQSYSRDLILRRIPLSVSVRAVLGEPLGIRVSDPGGAQAEVTWDRPLERAAKHPLSLELVKEQFGRLGDTPYELASVSADRLDPIMVPKSVLNDLRRKAVEKLVSQRALKARHAVADRGALDALRAEISERRAPRVAEGHRLYVLARTKEQLDAVLAWTPPPQSRRPNLVYVEMENRSAHRDAVRNGRKAGLRVALAAPRIIKPSEEEFLRAMLDCEPDAILVRNLAALSFFRNRAPGMPLIGDFSLNAANEISADLLVGCGLERLTPSYDMNWKQLDALLKRCAPELFEVVIHHHMPMFHMQHCLFAALFSDAADSGSCGPFDVAQGRREHGRNGGRPCDRGTAELLDSRGAKHPLHWDGACRNTVFNESAQSACEWAQKMMKAGVRHFRIELLRGSADETGSLLTAYAQLLAGASDESATWKHLQKISAAPMTRGTFQFT